MYQHGAPVCEKGKTDAEKFRHHHGFCFCRYLKRKSSVVASFFTMTALPGRFSGADRIMASRIIGRKSICPVERVIPKKETLQSGTPKIAKCLIFTGGQDIFRKGDGTGNAVSCHNISFLNPITGERQNARISFQNVHAWPEYGRSPRAVARHRDERW
jgi:hypothetical protein